MFAEHSEEMLLDRRRRNGKIPSEPLANDEDRNESVGFELLHDLPQAI